MVKEIIARVRRLAEPAKEPEVVEKVVTRTVYEKPKASMGTEIFAGYLSEEYLDKLRGKKLAIEFDKIRRSDSQIKMLLAATKNPVKAAKWEVEPASDSEEDIKIAALIKHILLDDMAKPFPKTVGEILSCVDFGHSVLEPIYKLVIDHPEFKTYHGLHSLALISQKTIEKWNVNPDNGELVSIEQIANGDLRKHVTISAEDFLLFTMEQEGANYEGVSWLRACYGNWYRKNVYLKLNAIGIEKFAVPTIVIEFAQGEQNTEQFDLILEAVELYTSGQANYVTKPNGYAITFERNAYDPEKVEMSIDREDGRMSKAFCANFLELGTGGNGGAFALSDDLSDFFYAGIAHVADEVSGPINAKLIPYLVGVNFGPKAKYPKLVHTGISDKAGKELAEILGLLIDKKVVIPDLPLEERMRKKYNFGEKSDQDQRDASPPAPFGAGKPGEDPENPGATEDIEDEDPGEADPKKKLPPKAPPAPKKKTLAERVFSSLYG